MESLYDFWDLIIFVDGCCPVDLWWFSTVNCWSGLFRWIYDGLAIGFRFVDGIMSFVVVKDMMV